ncbi:MAG: Fe-S-cluster-containing dehydrogenase component [Planctomycetota bacterium]
MQLGFVIDQSRCIGCHACTVACKSENSVPVGDFRTWVKYTEEGTFPEVKRSYAVLRCNQCTDAPCIEICPTNALEKRPDGIVDINPDLCIGCKSCMHGCPYDALHINDETGTAEKCHFCAHRTEQGLAPACAVVCPTEAIIPGDFDDPDSAVSRMRAKEDLSRRKVEAGTGPNVFYKDVTEAAIDPGLTNLSGGSIWAQNPTGPRVDAQAFEAMEAKATETEKARTVYDVPRNQLWGGKITGYLWAKSIAAGLFPAAWLAASAGGTGTSTAASIGWLVPALALVFLSITGVLLVLDLKRPDRFYYIIIRPNWSSWLARGTFIIMAYSGLLTLWGIWGIAGYDPGRSLGTFAAAVTCFIALATAAYTGWLFSQAKGRVLWMKRGYWFHLVIQAMLAGSSTLLIFGALMPWNEAATSRLQDILVIALAGQWLMMSLENKMAPVGREAEYHRAERLITAGPYARLHWIGSVGIGVVIPLLLLVTGLGAPFAILAGVLALAGLWIHEDVFVRAGQALPIS